jgi:hypothetical protein
MDLEALQQERRAIFLAPLGMKPLRTSEVSYTFGGWYDADKIARDEDSLLGYQMALMEHICAEGIRRGNGENHGRSLDEHAEDTGQLRPAGTETQEPGKASLVCIKEATQRRMRGGRTESMEERTDVADDRRESVDKRTASTNEYVRSVEKTFSEEKKRLRKKLIVKVNEGTRHRTEKRSEFSKKIGRA